MTGRSRWDLPVLILACLFPTLAAYVYFVFFKEGPQVQAAYAISKLLQFGLPVAWAWWAWPERFTGLRLSSKGLIAGIAFGLLVAVVMILLFETSYRGSKQLAQTPALLGAKLQGAGITTATSYVALALFISLLHSFLEEYYWRWFVFGGLRHHVAWPWAVGLSSVAFALHHVVLIGGYLPPDQFWKGTVFFSFCVAVGGAVWAYLYHKSGSLYGCWISHALVDLALVWIGYQLCWEYLQ